LPCCSPSRKASLSSCASIGIDNRKCGDGLRAATVQITGGCSFVGTDQPEIAEDGEGPKRAVHLNNFSLEIVTVTNARFADFVAATGYVSEAERLGWSPVFFASGTREGLANPVGTHIPWWHIVEGANWRRPEGAGSSIEDRLDHPVVHISWHDANEFARWVGGRLPSEAEWEHAARGGADIKRFTWGDSEPDDEENIFCNIWQGQFPDFNSGKDGYMRTAPAVSFSPNILGFYNMLGNVWEWTQEAFRIRSHNRAARARNAAAFQHKEKLLKGGSFLCHKSYCYRYRIAARMGLSPDSAGSNISFRIAYD